MVMYLDTQARILQLMKERNWTAYRLAKEAGLAQSTITNVFKRSTTPSIPTLETICKGFGITMAQFFRKEILWNCQRSNGNFLMTGQF